LRTEPDATSYRGASDFLSTVKQANIPAHHTGQPLGAFLLTEQGCAFFVSANQMSHSYDIGNQVICQAAFTYADTGVVIDPTNVYFQFKTPARVITSYQYSVDPEVARLSEGVYTATVNVTQAGDWFYRWYSTGIGMAAGENRFNAKSSEFD